MALFRIDQESPLPTREVWRRLTAWERHGDVVPLTRVVVRTPQPTGEGTVFVARTGLGRRIGFDDVMEVVVWRPPGPDGAGVCRLEKRGSFVTGWAEIEVSPRPGAAGSLIAWREDLRVRWMPAFCDGALRPAARWMFGRAVTRLLASPPPRPDGDPPGV
ncbi:SRPBCC family protein [Streptomyces sp. NBC_01381]|uniref:SRPBCC family protein n=1 Tax=Streptomyces sp. NBC_01381 TaxID=2903845 RepID=UPI002252B073|nr:SRPBCC family protein [Streptomyces sp. NBC_01381]MCX4670908.1 SRPBCC family protein [Streptomyces sp. NBC_01381]